MSEQRTDTVNSTTVARLLVLGKLFDEHVASGSMAATINGQICSLAVLTPRNPDAIRLVAVDSIGQNIFNFFRTTGMFEFYMFELATKMVTGFAVAEPGSVPTLCRKVKELLDRSSCNKSGFAQAFVLGILRAFKIIREDPNLRSSLVYQVVDEWSTALVNWFFFEPKQGIKLISFHNSLGSRLEDELGQLITYLRNSDKLGRAMHRLLLIKLDQLFLDCKVPQGFDDKPSFIGQLTSQLTIKYLAGLPSNRQLSICASDARLMHRVSVPLS